MRIRTLFAALAFVPAFLSVPAAADSNAGNTPSSAAASLKAITPPPVCLATAKGPRVAQLNCCSAHKGLCGCRAGKIVCCDGTLSTEAGCTCHGDEGVAE